ncbi:MAG: alpha/beta hydrolase, partial [Alphaproteobacteria bacterium]|nr:alpha/beta hydrolase [Alphaproteobacteria bacterium]
MSSKIEILTGGGGTLCGLYNRPVESSAKAGRKAHTLVVMAHGFPGGHKGGQGDLYGEMQFLLAEHGLHSLRFDFRGCGESTGFPERFTLASAQEDLKHVVLWAKGRGYKEIAYVGEGL